MKILHTSDWHIGQRFQGLDRTEEHELFFNWLYNTIEQESINVILISGDIFDVGYPSNIALKQYYQFLTKVKNTSLQRIIITGGNHDHISTLDAPKELLNALDIDVIGGVTDNLEDEIIPLYNDANEVESVVLAVPFLRDRDIRQAVAGESYDDKAEATKHGIAQHYVQLIELSKEKYDSTAPIVAMGHFTMNGASTSDSEREIHIGNLASMTLSELPTAINYWAMGHIHRPQKIGGNENVRYSGSPIQLSFSERKDKKQVVILDSNASDTFLIQTIDVPAFRPLKRITGSIEECQEQLDAFDIDSDLQAWIEVNAEEEFADPALVKQFEELLASFTENESFHIVKHTLRFRNQITGTAQLLESTRSLNEMEVTEVFDTLIDRGEYQNPDELKQTFTLLREWMDK